MLKIFLIILFSLLSLFSVDARDYKDIKAILNVGNMPIVEREGELENYLNRWVFISGSIINVEETKLYKKTNRVILKIKNKKIEFVIHLYAGSHAVGNLKIGDEIDIKGKIINFTQLNSKRNKYIVDIFLEKLELKI